MMTPADIIAIVAIVVSGIYSIVSAIISYKVNKENIVARRSELAFEKRLDAFATLMGNIGRNIHFLASGHTLVNSNNEQEKDVYYQKSVELVEDFAKAYSSQRVFFPKHIAELIDGFVLVLGGHGGEIYREIMSENPNDSNIENSLKE